MAYAHFVPDEHRFNETPPAPIGHNRAPVTFVDPGPATDFVDRGPLAIHSANINANDLQEFYDAVRSQGSEDVRQAALSNTAARARADYGLGHLWYRIFEQFLSRTRWQYRYHCEPMQTAAYLSATDPKNLRRPVDGLVDLGLLRRIYIPRRSGGRPMPFLTVVCSAEDRSGETLEILRRGASLRGISSDAQDDNPIRHHDGLQLVTMTGSQQSNPQEDGSTRHVEGLQTVIVTGANPSHDAHTVEVTVDIDCIGSEEEEANSCSPSIEARSASPHSAIEIIPPEAKRRRNKKPMISAEQFFVSAGTPGGAWEANAFQYGIDQGFSENEIQRHGNRFQNHHLSKDNAFADWMRAWRYWLSGETPGAAGHGRSSPREGAGKIETTRRNAFGGLR